MQSKPKRTFFPRFRSAVWFIASAFIALSGVSASARAQPSSFTYQGQVLNVNGQPEAGPVDIRLRIYDNATGGNQQGPTLGATALALNRGIFTLSLDFGISVFTPNSPRWLEIDIARAGSADFTTLAPRQPLSATPFALNTRGIFVDASSRVGIKIDSPQTTLDVRGTFHAGGDPVADAGNRTENLTRAGTPSWQSFTPMITGELQSVTFRGLNSSNWTGSVRIFAGEGIAGTPLTSPIPISDSASLTPKNYTVPMPTGVALVAGQKYTLSITTSPNLTFSLNGSNPYSGGVSSFGSSVDLYFDTSISPTGLTVNSQGRTGIGTTTPTDALEVRGNIRFGLAGNIQVIGGEETLRVIRGSVSFNGTIGAGTGFAVTPLVNGTYQINFSTPFLGDPTITLNTTDFRIVRVGLVSPSSFRVDMVDLNGLTVGSGFHFIAVGPR